jgi:hypothetical protein
MYTSKIVRETNDWEYISLSFNTGNNENVDIGFRLGNNGMQCTGTAWFSDFKLEKGQKINSSNWNVGCFVFNTTNLSVGTGTNLTEFNYKINNNDVNDIKVNLERFKTSMNEFTNGKININYEVNLINTPLTSVSYSDEFGYYVSSADVKEVIDAFQIDKKYNYIFVCVRLRRFANRKRKFRLDRTSEE